MPPNLELEGTKKPEQAAIKRAKTKRTCMVNVEIFVDEQIFVVNSDLQLVR
jgi:hypothetical protein